jgi:uncharacterized membrane protein
MIGMASTLVSLGVLVLIILMAIKAYQGTPIRLPIIAEMADKNA